MRRSSILIPLCLILAATACGPASKTPAYSYGGETEYTVDDRSLILEDIPASAAEETVILEFLYTIQGEFDKKKEILADIEPHNISIDNEKDNFNDGIYLKTYTVHQIDTLTPEQYKEPKSENGSENPLCYYGIGDEIEQFKLTDYAVIHVKFSWDYSEKMLENGPQWGPGEHERSFLVGKSNDDKNYKIYSFGIM